MKYPNIHYHAFDASSGFWSMRNDYPHYLLYQDGDKAKETLENWQPKGENPFYGSIDGRFIAPKELKALGGVPPGSKAAVIHPKVQERMERDPACAQEIYAKIDACSSSSGRVTFSRSGTDDDTISWWDLRMARHGEFMKLLVEGRIEDQTQSAQLAASAAARSQLAAMMSGGRLQEIFGDKIAGIPTETILALTKAQVWGGAL